MAFVRTFLISTFDENDTYNDKESMRKLYESQGYLQISEVKTNETGIVKEWVFASPPILGKFNRHQDDQTQGVKKAELFNFNAENSVDGD